MRLFRFLALPLTLILSLFRRAPKEPSHEHPEMAPTFARLHKRWTLGGIKERYGMAYQTVPRWMWGLLEVRSGTGCRCSVGSNGILPRYRLLFLLLVWYRKHWPLPPRIVYAHYKCLCGARMGYDKNGVSGTPISGFWDCTAILLNVAPEKGEPGAMTHSDRMPWAFYELKVDHSYLPPKC